MEEDWYSQSTATFGDRLTAAREATGLSVRDLAQRVGVKPSTLQAWEDDVKEPRANRLSMLAGMLGVSLRWILTGEGEGLPAPVGDESRRAEIASIAQDLRALRGSIARDTEALGRLEARLVALSAGDA